MFLFTYLVFMIWYSIFYFIPATGQSFNWILYLAYWTLHLKFFNFFAFRNYVTLLYSLFVFCIVFLISFCCLSMFYLNSFRYLSMVSLILLNILLIILLNCVLGISSTSLSLSFTNVELLILEESCCLFFIFLYFCIGICASGDQDISWGFNFLYSFSWSILNVQARLWWQW
jgi:hypothetical protein